MKNYILIKITKVSRHSAHESEVIGVYINKYDAYKMALNMIKERYIFESTLPNHTLYFINERYNLYEQIFDAALAKAYRKALNLYNKNAYAYKPYMQPWTEYKIVPHEVIESSVELDIPTNLIKKQRVFQ